MGRIVQPRGEKGSLKWVQHIVNECPETPNGLIRNYPAFKDDPAIECLSPLADYSEYRDQAFLDLLRIRLEKKKLKDF